MTRRIARRRCDASHRFPKGQYPWARQRPIILVDCFDPSISVVLGTKVLFEQALWMTDPRMPRGLVRLLSAQGFDTRAFASAEAFLDDEKAKSEAARDQLSVCQR
jgi:hypothetical protein